MAKKSSKPTAIQTAKVQFLAKLTEWGFDDEKVAKDLGITFIAGEQKLGWVPKDARGHVAGAARIEYYDLDGQPLRTAEGAEPYTRDRFFFSPGSVLDLEKICKYAQPPGTTPAPYFSKAVDWRQVLAERKPLIITEGEMKANKACASGFPTIAIGGVDSFAMMNERHLSLLPALEKIDWQHQYVYIVYDSDISEKENVARAMVRLANVLVERGAIVYVVYLPPLPPIQDDGEERKCGLDDYLVEHGEEAFAELLHDAEPIASAEKLLKLNSDYCLVQTARVLVDMQSMEQIKLDSGVGQLFANVEYYVTEYTPSGPRPVRKNIFSEWLKWPQRNDVRRLVYEPGFATYTPDEFGRRALNTWTGWGAESVEGGVKPFVKLIEFVLQNCSEAERAWFWQWLAYPIQNPGAKLNTAVVVYSNAEGTGKTMIAEDFMSRIYGRNFGKATNHQVRSQFTAWIDSKQFVLGDEITGAGNTADARIIRDTLNDVITGKLITINRKNQQPYDIRNHANFYFTTNHANAFFMHTGDRRLFVVRGPEYRESETFYDELSKFRDSERGISALRFHLENKVDCSDFNPFAAAPRTDAKDDMTSMGQNDFGQWIADILGGGPIMVKQQFARGAKPLELKCDLFTANDLLRIFDPSGESGVKARAAQLELGSQTQKVMGGKGVRLSDGTQARLWILRNLKKWAKVSDSKTVVDHYEKQRLKD